MKRILASLSLTLLLFSTSAFADDPSPADLLALVGELPLALPNPPPQSFACTPGPHCVGVFWTAPSDGSSNYQVYRLPNLPCPATAPASVAAAVASGWVLISGATPLTTTTYIDNGFPLQPLPLGQYCYFVVSSIGGVQSLPSNTVAAVLLPGSPLNVGAIPK